MKNNLTIADCKLINLNQIGDRRGNITPLNNDIDIPFSVKRIFYLYDIPGGESRGAHAHKECHQFLIAASGSYEVILDDSISQKKFFLNRPDIGLHIPPGIWASEVNFSSGSICLVLASHEYSENDYIRSYDDYIEYKGINGVLTKLSRVNIKDAAFICELRNNPLNNIYLSSTESVLIDQQVKWINNNNRTTDIYLLIKNKHGVSVGTISLYNIKNKNAEFGRYICQNPLNALESVYLVLNYAFEILDLEYVYCKTKKENDKVWRQHIKFGFKFEDNDEIENIENEFIIQKISKKDFYNFDYSWLNILLNKFEQK